MIDREQEELIEINHGLRLIQKKNGLKFGSDALLLAAFIGSHGSLSRAIELGAGTGVISLLTLSRGQIGSVTALEVQEEYARLTARNAELNGLSERLTVAATDLRDYPRKEQADVIFTNPPYMKSNSGKQNLHEEKRIARHEVCGTIEDFCRCGAGMLKFGGMFYAVFRPDRLTDLIVAMRSANLEPKRLQFVAMSPSHAPSLVLIEGKKGAASGCMVQRLFYFRMEDGSESEMAQKLQEEGIIDGK